MNAIEAIVLGVVQGLTEFLPISSTAHLRIVPALFGGDDPGAGFSAVIQLGTMAAVLVYFRSDILRIVTSWVREIRVPFRQKSHEARLGWFIILGTIPISVFGLVFKDQIESGARSLLLIGCALIIFSLVMLAADKYGRKSRRLTEMTVRDGLVVGVAQALALIPGISRSGATISAGLLRNFTRADAARYSFLLSIPAVVLSGLFELPEIGGGSGASVGATVIAGLVAFISGYAAIAWLLRYLARHTLSVFIAYRILLGALIIVLAVIGLIE
ncbi:MAG: undecaprenyl-diphosphate phosphatase [Thermoleophilia bacterium]|jgi:undecaprenyl-diphosphatase